MSLAIPVLVPVPILERFPIVVPVGMYVYVSTYTHRFVLSYSRTMAVPVPVHVRLPICCFFGYSCICRLNVCVLSIGVPVAVRLSVCQGVKKFVLNEENGYNEPVKSSQVDKLPVPGSQYLQTKTSSEKNIKF